MTSIVKDLRAGISLGLDGPVSPMSEPTATEVISLWEKNKPALDKLQEAFNVCQIEIYRRIVPIVILGFSKPHNRSNKPMARLKHSLTRLVCP